MNKKSGYIIAMALMLLMFVSCVPRYGKYWLSVAAPEEGGRRLDKITYAEDLVDTDARFAVSMDGTKIAFTSWKTGNGDIYVKSLTGGRALLQRTYRPETEHAPSFSPDGTKLAFHALRDGHFHIYMVGAESGMAIQQITTNTPADALNPVFSPDGNFIAFNSVDFVFNPQTGKYEYVPNSEIIWTYDLATGRLTQYTSGLMPRYTADGKKIIFKRAAKTGAGYYGLWMMDIATGSETEIIAGTDFGIWDYDISPDGSKIVFSSDKSTGLNPRELKNANLWVVNIDGTGLTQLTYHLSNDLRPVWAPDMTGIYFLSCRGEQNKEIMNIWRMNYEGK